MPVITFPFTTDTNYLYSSDITVSGGIAELSLVDNLNQTYIQDFANDTGFTYDSNLVEFAAGIMRQLDQVDEATCGATLDSGLDLESWSNGVVTGTATGGAAVLNNRLDLAHNDVRYVSFAGLNNVSTAAQQGCIRLKWTPNYSGNPPSNQIMFHMGEGTTANNNVTLLHSSSGQGSLTITDQAGAGIVTVALGLFVPVAGTTYELELNWDVAAGTPATRIFVNGGQFGATDNSSGTRTNTASVLRLGAGRNGTEVSDCFIEDVMVFDTVQHTANYTSGYTVATKRYAADNITLPQEAYSGLGAVQSFTNFTSGVSTDVPHYTINSLYYNGTNWVATANTYITANTEADVLTNIATLPASDTLDITLFFTDTDTQGSVDALTTTYTGQLYAQTNPTVTPTSTFGADDVSVFISTVTAAGSDAVTFVIEVSGTNMYWTGAAWAASTGYAQSNTAADINTNIDSLLSTGSSIRPVVYLHSNDGSTTPNVDVIALTYDFFAVPPASPETIVVYGRILDIDSNPVGGCTVECTVDQNGDLTTNHWASKYTVQTTSNANGDWELEVLRSSAFETPNTTFTFAITRLNETKKYKKYAISLPDTIPSVAYNTL